MLLRPEIPQATTACRPHSRLGEVLLIHAEQIARYGGGTSMRDVGMLESAIATPRASFDGELLNRDLFEMIGER